MPFFDAGVSRGERCLYLAQGELRPKMSAALARLEIDPTQEQYRGAVIIASVEELGGSEGGPSPSAFVSFLKSFALQARSDGFAAIRIAMEMDWVLEEGASLAHLREYETLLNRWLAEDGGLMRAICQFNREKVPIHNLSTILQLHARVAVGQHIFTNPYHQPPDSASQEDTETSIFRWLLSLMDQASAGVEAKEMRDSLAARVEQRDLDMKVELMKHLATQRRMVKLNRLYQVQSQVNHVIFRTRDKQKLLEEACRLAVSVGRFRAAWAGLTDRSSGDVRKVASWGQGCEYMESIGASSLDVPNGRGVVGTAIRQGKHSVCNDIATDPRMYPWRTEATGSGFCSCAAFPLSIRRHSVGAICIYSTQPSFFNDEELRLLDDMAADISFALQAIDDEEQRRFTELALRASEQRFRRLMENIQDVIYRYEVRPTPGYSYISPACTDLLGYPPEEYFTDPSIASKLVHPEDLHTLETLPARITQRMTTTLRWIHKDGHEVYIEQRDVPIFDEDGNLVAIEGVARNVTESKQLQEQLLRAQRLEAAGRIAGQVAHDFNNLLGPLAAYPELMKMQIPPDHPFQGYCDSMLQAAQLMADINEDMMAMARRGHLRDARLELNALIKRIVDQLAPTPTTLEIKTNLCTELLPINGSASQLSRVLVNLITNAREAMNDRGTLTLSTENVYLDRPVPRYNTTVFGEYVRVSVVDTGSGIPREIREKVFDAFFSTKGSAGRRGCGLGLSVVHNITEDHHGYVEISSEVGVGTTFSLYFPVFRDAAAIVADETTPTGSERLLLVDDDIMQREVVGQMLRILGYSVKVVSTGEEAVEFLKRDSVDLVILDMIMPGIDGTETYRRITELHPGQPAILISGWAETGRMEEALSMGIGAYLRKPLTMTVLSQAIREQFAQPQTLSEAGAEAAR